MKLRNIFEIKAQSNNKNIYTQMVQTRGRTPQYTDVNYECISKEGYMENFVFFRCIQEIVKAAIQGEWKVMRYKTNGEAEEVKNHPAKVVLEKPNPIYTQSELIKRAISFYFIGGEAPFHKITVGNRVKEIYAYRPDRVIFTPTGQVDAPYEDIKYNSGTLIPIEPDKFCLWKNFNPVDQYDGLGHGMSVLQPVLKSGDLLNAFIDWNVSLLQNGASPSGAYVTSQSLGDIEFERAKEQIRQEHQGTINAGNVLLLEGGGNWIKMGENPKDMDWTEGKNSTIIDICCGIGVDPILVGYNKFSSYNNKKEARKELYSSTVKPIMRDLADVLSPFLMLAENEYLEMDFSHTDAMQEDEKDKIEKLSKATFMSENEKRQHMNLETVDGGDVIIGSNYIIKDGKFYAPMSLHDIDEEVEPRKPVTEEEINNTKGY